MNTRFFSVTAVLIGLLAARASPAQHTVLVNAVGMPSSSQLFVANADGSGERALLRDPNRDYDASFSPDAQWIVFTSERNGSADLYRVHADGTGLEQLTAHQSFDGQGAISPDGRQLAFVSTREGGRANIWILDLRTLKLRNLTGGRSLRASTGTLAGYFRPAWSPDGQWLAFSSDRGTAHEDHRLPAAGWEHIQRGSVYIVRQDGSDLRKLSNDAEFAGSPKWSADGRQIVFYSLDPEQTFVVRIGVEAGGNSSIVAVEVDGGRRTEYAAGSGLKVSPQFVAAGRVGYLMKATGKLAYSDGETSAAGTAAGLLRNPAWSPDGKLVVYHKLQIAMPQAQPIYSADPSYALRFSGEFPAVSSAGKVAMSPFFADGVALFTANGVGLYVGDLGGNYRQIFKRPGANTYAPAWSPDGQWIAATHGEALTQTRITRLLLMKADGSEERELGLNGDSGGFPSFSSDGKYIVFRAWGGPERRGLRILNLQDNSTRMLTTEDDSFPAWSPQGDRICFTRKTAAPSFFDIFTIRPDGGDLKQLTNVPGNDAHCAWSPDQQNILFSSSRLGWRDEAPLYDQGPQPYAELFVMRANGADQMPVTDDKWEQGTPAWVPGKK